MTLVSEISRCLIFSKVIESQKSPLRFNHFGILTWKMPSDATKADKVKVPIYARLELIEKGVIGRGSFRYK